MKKIVVLTGAGMSAESGISTFRGGNGLWDEYPVEQVATPEGYRADPVLVLEFYNTRRRQLLEVEPNEGHKLLAGLESEFDVTVVTQNVDNLHERAGSTNVIHLHGELMKVCSSREPYNEKYIKTLSPDEVEVKVGDLAPDGSQFRPFIVWFGEAVPKIEDAIAALADVDIFIIIGTSLNVYPAAGLLNYVPASVPVYLIDPNEVNVTRRGVTVIRKGASEGMRILIDEYLSKIK
ncbi:MAG: NAD-dependent deacylase [Bacteroidaceae bacterium]|nr:NAD-dependent deacylase [Bacteroidaceae bacterium]